MGFYCFYLPPGYRPEVNAENLKKAGIGGYREVGDELVKIFRDKLDQKDLADKLEKFVHRDNSCLLYTSPSPRDATLSRMPSSA